MDYNQGWRIVSPGRLAWREWDGQAVMYDERTGATHMLGAGATAVWSALASAGGASSVEALALALASGEDDRDEPVATEVVSSVLADLARLGVLEAVKP